MSWPRVERWKKSCEPNKAAVDIPIALAVGHRIRPESKFSPFTQLFLTTHFDPATITFVGWSTKQGLVDSIFRRFSWVFVGFVGRPRWRI